MTPRARTLLTSLALASALASAPWAAASLPPWLDPDDVPLPAGVRAAVPKKDGLFVFLEPSRRPVRRGPTPRPLRDRQITSATDTRWPTT